MREKLLTKIGELAARKTWWMLLAIIVITLIFGAMSEHLEMSMNLTDILPSDDPMVDEFNTIFTEFNGASTIFVVLEGDYDHMIQFAEDISLKLKNLDDYIENEASDKIKAQHATAMANAAAGEVKFDGKYIDRVDYKMPVEFIKNHGLMLIKPEDLKNTENVFYDPNLLPFLTNLNNSLEKEYINSEEKISTTQREQNAVKFLDGIESWVDAVNDGWYAEKYNPEVALTAAEAVSIGSPYLVSPDRSVLLIMVEPTFNIMEMDLVLPAVNAIEEMVKNEAPNYHVKAGLTGGIVLGRDEYVAGMEDSMLLTILSLVAVFVLFVVTFRMLSAPLLAMLNLIIGLVWAMGISWLLVGMLNMFTAMMAVVLVGLGIDFSIHIISVFSELVQKGVDPNDAIVETMRKVGGGIITGAFTTAAAFLTLMIARSDGMSGFGLVCGVGLIVLMIGTLVTMPTMLMLRERYRSWRGKELKKTQDVSYRAVGNFSESIFKRWRFSLIGILLITAFLGIMISRVTMDYNYLNMEPVGLESIKLNDKVIKKFNFSSDVTMMTANSLKENYELTEAAKEKPSVSYVESLSDYLPTVKEQNERRLKVRELRQKMEDSRIAFQATADAKEELKSEVQRLMFNVIELQELAFTGGQDQVDEKAIRLVGTREHPDAGNLNKLLDRLEAGFPDNSRLIQFNRDFGKNYKQIVLNMADDRTITMDMLPPLIHNKYISEDGNRFLITLYPKGNVWHIDYLEAFTEDVLSITHSISGTPPMFYYMLKIIGQDGRRAIFLTLAVVFVLLLIDFRSIKHALFAMLPLCVALVWTVGFMGLTGIQFTLLNIMAIPLILGIGIDDGVHVLHRYKTEGPGSVNTVFRSTGKAIIITSLTTMLAFGSLVFATYRGFGSLGLALFIGVGMCLLVTVTLMPAIMAIIERKKQTSG
ncbi:MAG: efflux RND transporter permease subunit [Fidelibacterota bacterium]